LNAVRSDGHLNFQDVDVDAVLTRRMLSANVQKLTDLLTEQFNAW